MAQDGKTFIFIDGQNLYLSARNAFGARLVPYPNFEPSTLADIISHTAGIQRPSEVRFYTGMPVERFSPRWHEFWVNKTSSMEDDGIGVFTTPLRYQYESDPHSPNGIKVLSTREKGIDMRIGLDVMKAARRKDCAHIVIVSRDQDFQQVIGDIELMTAFERREVKLWSAYPDGGNGPSHLRGIDGMDEIVITQEMYENALDHRDHRGKFAPRESQSPLPG